jgi:peptide/nickel transport system permease protein
MHLLIRALKVNTRIHNKGITMNNKQNRTKKYKKTNLFIETLRRLSKNVAAVMGLIIILILAFAAIFAPLLTPFDYAKTDLKNTFAKPSLVHPFGTDDLGRDILTRILFGGRFSLRIGIISIFFAVVGGLVIGSIAGYFGGKSDMIIMRALDVIQAVPGLILSIAISAVLGPGFTNCIIALAIGMIPGFARMIRASILNVRKMEYIEAAQAINAGNFRIITRHVLPNAIQPLIVTATMGLASAILIAASLSFIGLGVQPPTPEWGAMLTAGRGYIRNYPHLVIFPGITIMIAVLSLNMLGDGLRDALDPRLKD